MAGDWRLYLEALVLPGAKVAYEAEPLNVHRRHAASVTHALDANRHVAEIARCHAVAIREFALPEPVAVKQAEYAAEVAQQLGAVVKKPDVVQTPREKSKKSAQSRRKIARK
jgi:hypothetical protein